MKNSRINKWILFAIVLGFMVCGILTALPARAEVPITDNTAEDVSSDMAVDAYGNIHLVYERGGTIYHINKSSDGWGTEETVISGSYPAIALDSNGVPHIVFLSNGVKYTNQIGGGWKDPAETIGGSTSVNFVDMDIDGNDKVHVVYCAHRTTIFPYTTLFLFPKRNLI